MNPGFWLGVVIAVLAASLIGAVYAPEPAVQFVTASLLGFVCSSIGSDYWESR